MGTGHTVDTPIRVAHLGISSVISLVDDLLLERVRKRYCAIYNLPYRGIPRYSRDGRSKRITAYLDLVNEIVREKFEATQWLPFFNNNEKSRYFSLLPETSPLKQRYLRLLQMERGKERDALAAKLTSEMAPGSIDVNIMVKLDKMNFTLDGILLPDEYSDARAALRGYANSTLRSSIVLSAGINQPLFNYMTQFRDFYRDENGKIKKKIILKVSDYRSASIQGRVLAKKGLEVYEFRIESGLNCGGHAFASNGVLLPTLLNEFVEKREQFPGEFLPLIKNYYKEKGWEYPESAEHERVRLTVQGGIGTFSEAQRMMEGYGMDATGWASPFLLVPEATCVDDPTRALLAAATEKDLYLSEVSPLGVPFNNVRGSGSEVWTTNRVACGTPGSPCPKGFLVSNTEFTKQPICLASQEYQDLKLEQIRQMDIPAPEKAKLSAQIMLKTCICDHLGNGALIALGIKEPEHAPQSICPGPNIAWFTRIYSLKEMIDHIYGRGESLVPAYRPHMFAKEIEMYVDYFQRLVNKFSGALKELSTLREYKENLENGMMECLRIASSNPFGDENLASIPPCVDRCIERVKEIYAELEEKACPKEVLVGA
jgi:hypothetical protein